MKTLGKIAAAAYVFFFAQLAFAEDVFFHVPVSRLKLVEGALPKPLELKDMRWEMVQAIRPYAVLDGAGEVYVTEGDAEGNEGWWTGKPWSATTSVLAARAPAGAEVKGTIFVPKGDLSGLTPLRFTIPADEASAPARRDFYVAKESHFDDLQMSGVPGAAWFRRQATEAHREVGGEEKNANARRVARRDGVEMSDTYDLFTGGRAVSENLQLSREFAPPRISPSKGQPQPKVDETPVAISTIEGITVDAMDWTAAIGEGKPTLDALSAAIPADQHAAFFPSFDAMMAAAEETNEHGLPVFRGISGGSVDARVVERYEKQLCLLPTALTRLLGPKAIKSVAITGSDPYFPTGTDVAVIFQAADAKTLSQMLIAQARASATAAGGAEKPGEIGGVRYTGFTTADRAICSYVAVIGDVVAVTNSTVQIGRLAGVHDGSSPAIASLPEYRYFRIRYPLGADGETGLVFLSDATIRRWCGAQWRIGASRRIRAGAIMADVTAAHMGDLVKGVKESISVDSDTPMRTIGELSIGPGGVRSSIYGFASFQTPIAELGIKEVSPDEALAYKQWRDTYQRNWSWAFDPIAVSFSMTKAQVIADMSVMPLIVASEYRTWIGIGKGAAIGAESGDPHDAIAHAVVAINPESAGIRQASGMAHSLALGAEVDPLGWLGKSVALYADPDPFWGEMFKAPGISGTMKFVEENANRLPVAVCAEVGSVLKLAAFLAAVHAFVDQSAPGMIAWESRVHEGQDYVRAGVTDKAKAAGAGAEFDKVAVFYAATPRALIVTLSEDVLKRAIDRQNARAKPDAKPVARDRPWLGSSLCAQFTRQGFELINTGLVGSRTAMQGAAWSNIPILNEWKRKFPDQDPVRLHEAWWGVRLTDPAGGQYAWNSQFQTMESSTYGHPGEPKAGPEGLGPLNTITSGNAGVTFEDKGLRARVVLEREALKR
jgi:hypothetical protein